MSFRIQGDGTDCAPLPPKEGGGGGGGNVGVPRNLFPRLGGWVRFVPGEAWNLPSEGTSLGVFRLVSPAEGVSEPALARF